MEVFSYTQIADFFMIFLAVLGVVSLVLSLIIAWRTFRKPYDERNATINEHSEKLDRDWETLQELKGEMSMLLSGQMLIVQHLVTNDHIEKLIEHQDMVQRYLINHRGNL